MHQSSCSSKSVPSPSLIFVVWNTDGGANRGRFLFGVAEEKRRLTATTAGNFPGGTKDRRGVSYPPNTIKYRMLVTRSQGVGRRFVITPCITMEITPTLTGVV